MQSTASGDPLSVNYKADRVGVGTVEGAAVLAKVRLMQQRHADELSTDGFQFFLVSRSLQIDCLQQGLYCLL